MTRRRVFKHEAAKHSLHEIAEYLAREGSLATALRFLHRAESSFAFLLTTPNAGAVCEFHNLELQGVRRWKVKNFPKLLIYYQPVADGIIVLDVMHAARDQETQLRDRFKKL